MTEKIKPCYRDYRLQISTLFIGFRRDDKTSAEVKFWKDNFPNIKLGENIAFAITGASWLYQAKKDFPMLDFDTKETI